ncbi:hypothetical protein IST453_05005 [Burkholderia multivorans]|nr:hypothetical protein IST453_05005 [Burkholderia multivorans]CAB5331211.1 hypothetical protein IST495A_02324 [Burkholderia multivorans]
MRRARRVRRESWSAVGRLSHARDQTRDASVSENAGIGANIVGRGIRPNVGSAGGAIGENANVGKPIGRIGAVVIDGIVIGGMKIGAKAAIVGGNGLAAIGAVGRAGRGGLFSATTGAVGATGFSVAGLGTSG